MSKLTKEDKEKLPYVVLFLLKTEQITEIIRLACKSTKIGFIIDNDKPKVYIEYLDNDEATQRLTKKTSII